MTKKPMAERDAALQTLPAPVALTAEQVKEMASLTAGGLTLIVPPWIRSGGIMVGPYLPGAGGAGVTTAV
jgi:hypothetical protein